MGKTTCDVYFMLCVTLISLLMFSALRCLLLVRNNELLEGIPGSDIVISFLIGVRFDLIVVSYILLPLVFALLLPKGLGKRRIALLWLTSLFAITIFLGVAELDFYYEFHNRLNSIAVGSGRHLYLCAKAHVQVNHSRCGETLTVAGKNFNNGFDPGAVGHWCQRSNHSIRSAPALGRRFPQHSSIRQPFSVKWDLYHYKGNQECIPRS